MNNNLRKILTVAACIAVIGNSANTVFAETVSITGQATADGFSGNLFDNTTAQTYVWKSGDESSVNVNLNGGNLSVSNYFQVQQTEL